MISAILQVSSITLVILPTVQYDLSSSYLVYSMTWAILPSRYPTIILPSVLYDLSYSSKCSVLPELSYQVYSVQYDLSSSYLVYCMTSVMLLCVQYDLSYTTNCSVRLEFSNQLYSKTWVSYKVYCMATVILLSVQYDLSYPAKRTWVILPIGHWSI